MDLPTLCTPDRTFKMVDFPESPEPNSSTFTCFDILSFVWNDSL